MVTMTLSETFIPTQGFTALYRPRMGNNTAYLPYTLVGALHACLSWAYFAQGPDCLHDDPVIKMIVDRMWMPSTYVDLRHVYPNCNVSIMDDVRNNGGSLDDSSVTRYYSGPKPANIDPVPKQESGFSFSEIVHLGKQLLSDWNFEDYQTPDSFKVNFTRKETPVVHRTYKGSIVHARPGWSATTAAGVYTPKALPRMLRLFVSGGTVVASGVGTTLYTPPYDLWTPAKCQQELTSLIGKTVQSGSHTTTLLEVDFKLDVLGNVNEIIYTGESIFTSWNMPQDYKLLLTNSIRFETVYKPRVALLSTTDVPALDLTRVQAIVTSKSLWLWKERVPDTEGPPDWVPCTDSRFNNQIRVKTASYNNTGVVTTAGWTSANGTFEDAQLQSWQPKKNLTNYPIRTHILAHNQPELLYDLIRDIKGLGAIAAYDALSNVSTVLTSNHLETLAGLASLGELVSPIAAAVQFYRAARTGDIYKSSLAFLDLLADVKLVYSFGLAPTLKDAKELQSSWMKILPALTDVLKQPVTAYGSAQYIPSSKDFAPFELGPIKARAKIELRFDDTTIAGLLIGMKIVGLLPSPGALLELVPMSFVGDWFTNATKRLDIASMQLSPLIIRRAYTVVTWSTELPLPQDLIDHYGFTPVSHPASTFYYRTIYRMLPPIDPLSRLDLLRPSGVPDWGIAASLIWTFIRKQ